MLNPKNLYNIYSGLLIYDFVPEPVLQHRGDDPLSPGAPAAGLLSLPRPYQVGEAQIGTYLNGIVSANQLFFGLCRGLLRKDPKKRFPLERVRDHEWTTMSVDPATYNFADVVDCSESQSRRASIIQAI